MMFSPLVAGKRYCCKDAVTFSSDSFRTGMGCSRGRGSGNRGHISSARELRPSPSPEREREREREREKQHISSRCNNATLSSAQLSSAQRWLVRGSTPGWALTNQCGHRLDQPSPHTPRDISSGPPAFKRP